MRAIMVMFDSLKRDWLPPYGGDVIAPNFQRLAASACTFDQFYIGSMPCMPARRELHTGRYNFLHKGWSPLEPFDDSMPELLRNAGIHTHLVSDHHHYWREGGGNYHVRYTTNEHIRGQEGDPWKGEVGATVPSTGMMEAPAGPFAKMFTQDGINRKYMKDESQHAQTRTFDAGLSFIETNHQADNWFLTIECFDPHEPFFTYEAYKKQYPSNYEGRPIDWPSPTSADQDADYIAYVQNQYKALVTMLDKNLGRVLDAMDAHDMWQDTMLIVNTDHGILLGEHDWWSKGAMPPYNEIARLPFFLWDPRFGVKNQRRQSLAQNRDVAATLLEFFGQPLPKDMEGRPLCHVIKDDTAIHNEILFGYFGGSINITDGKHVYMHGPANPENAPLYEYTLIPAQMGSRADVNELQDLHFADPFAFTKGCKTLRIDKSKHNNPYSNPYRYGSRLYDIETDPLQLKKLHDPALALSFCHKIAQLMKENDAPAEQYLRLGLSETMTIEELQAQQQAFEENQKPDVLQALPWTMEAVNQFKTLCALSKGKIAPSDFEAYVHNEQVTKILPETVAAFAKATLDPSMLGMVLMMTSLAGRAD